MTSKNTQSATTTKGKIRVGMISLGCPKTLVDSETILGKLPANQYEIVNSATSCDVALLNTCAFIQDSQQESVDRIMELIALKEEQKIGAIVVMGCLVQRYPEELQKELKEVDAFIGSGEYAKIPEIVDRVFSGKRVVEIETPGYLASASENRFALTPGHYRYLKISEGCDHICTFCTIPSFRGKHRSRMEEDILKEARSLLDQGAKELILTGQDTTYYGRDHSGGDYKLPELLHQLDKLPGMEWIRVMYAYPSCITEEMMKAIGETKHVCHYLDMPLQHASDAMLTAMKRGITKRRTLDLIHKFKSIVPDLTIRTTMIVGFPGETDQDFEELLDFVREVEFDRLGVFKYSEEAGTPAADLPNQVDEEVKQERYDRLMMLQQEISLKKNKAFVGKTLKVLIEEQGEEAGVWIGRSYRDAPEIDGTVIVNSDKHSLRVGQFYPIFIESAEEYDLIGKFDETQETNT